MDIRGDRDGKDIEVCAWMKEVHYGFLEWKKFLPFVNFDAGTSQFR